MNRKEEMEALADAIEKADWSGASIGNKVMLQGAVAALRASAAPEEGGREAIVNSLLLQSIGGCFDGAWEGPMLLPEKVKALAQKITSALPSDSGKAAPVALWQYRFFVGGNWNPTWMQVDGSIDAFREKFAFNFDNGTCEVRPLYAALAPATEGGGNAVELAVWEFIRELRYQGLIVSREAFAAVEKMKAALFPSPSARAKTQSKEEK